MQGHPAEDIAKNLETHVTRIAGLTQPYDLVPEQGKRLRAGCSARHPVNRKTGSLDQDGKDLMRPLGSLLLVCCLLTPAFAAAQAMTTPEGDLDLAAIERELEEAEAEAAMTHLKMSQGPSSTLDKTVNAALDSDSKPPVEIALACGIIEGDRPENTQFLLRPDKGTILTIPSQEDTPYRKTPFKYEFPFNYMREGQKKTTECVLERHTLKYMCFSKGEAVHGRGKIPCVIIKDDPLPSSGAHLIECGRPNSRPSDAYRVDFSSGIALDKDGGEWTARTVEPVHILLTKPSKHEGVTEYCAIDRYTRKYGCDLQPDGYGDYLNTPTRLLMSSSQGYCKITPPKI